MSETKKVMMSIPVEANEIIEEVAARDCRTKTSLFLKSVFYYAKKEGLYDFGN